MIPESNDTVSQSINFSFIKSFVHKFTQRRFVIIKYLSVWEGPVIVQCNKTNDQNENQSFSIVVISKLQCSAPSIYTQDNAILLPKMPSKVLKK